MKCAQPFFQVWHTGERKTDFTFEFNYCDKISRKAEEVQFIPKEIKTFILCEKERLMGLQLVKYINNQKRNFVMIATTTSPHDFEALMRIGLIEIPKTVFCSVPSLCNKLNVVNYRERKYQDKELVLAIGVYSQILEKYNYPPKEEFNQLLQSDEVKQRFVIQDVTMKGQLHVLQLLFVKFLFDHKCNEPRCEEYTYFKCGNCRSTHFCSQFCQVRDDNGIRWELVKISKFHDRISLQCQAIVD